MSAIYIKQVVLLNWLARCADQFLDVYLQTNDNEFNQWHSAFVSSWKYINSLSKADYNAWLYWYGFTGELEAIGYPMPMNSPEQLQLFAA